MMSTSVIRGTLVRTWRPSASRQAAISLSTEFLAPPARTVPESGPFDVTTNRSTRPVWPAGAAASLDGARLPARGRVPRGSRAGPAAPRLPARGRPASRPAGPFRSPVHRREPPVRDGQVGGGSAQAPATIVMVRDHRNAGTRSQPGHGARAGHRGGRAGGLTVDGAGRQGGCRRGRGASHAHRPVVHRHGRGRRHRRRREGPCPDALQRGAHRGRHAAEGRHRRRPHRRHHPDGTRPRRRAGGDRRLRAGHDVRPRAVRLHGEAGRRIPVRSAASTSPCPSRTT